MSDIVSRWASRLQISPRSQRVLSEALLDWQHEVTTAPTLMSSLAAHVTSTFGLCRALLMLTVTSGWEVVSTSWLLRFLICWLIPSALMNFRGFWPGTDFADALEQSAISLLSWVWVAPFYAVLTAPKSSRPPRLGLAVFAIASVVISAQWLLPSAVAYEIMSRGGVPPSGPVAYYTIANYVMHFAFIGAAILLASAMRLRERSSKWWLAFPMAFPLVSDTVIHVLTDWPLHLFARPSRELMGWTMVLIMIGCWCGLVRRFERRQVQP